MDRNHGLMSGLSDSSTQSRVLVPPVADWHYNTPGTMTSGLAVPSHF